MIHAKHIKYFDLHCDTLYKAYTDKMSLYDKSLDISFSSIPELDRYTQILAVWSKHNLSEDQAFEQFINILDYTEKELTAFASEHKNFSYILAVEGGKLLCGKIERLNTLFQKGVRFLTLVWQDECCIGGAHNLSSGFTDFGFEVLDKCFDTGIIPDVSHASDKMFYQTAEISKEKLKPFIATHSNSRTVCEHSRNLTDDMFLTVKECGGLVGISMAPQHLNKNGDSPGATVVITDVLKHIEHYLSLGGEDILCFGCDFDGIDTKPSGINGIESIPYIYEEMIKHYSQDAVDKIFYKNANNFIIRNRLK